jgi:hypothetical protein
VNFAMLNPYLLYIKIAGAALAFAAIFGAGMWLEGTIKQHTIDGLKIQIAQKQAGDATASLKQLQAFISRIQLSAIDYRENQDALFAAIDKLHGDFAKATHLKPLPASCRPDDERLRILAASVAAANAAAAGRGSGSALRGHQ